MWAALQQYRGDAQGAELVEPRADPRGLVFARRHEHLGPRGFERVGLGAGGRT